MMDGRVKTLHPKIHGGILARRDRPDDLAAAATPRHRPGRPRRRQPVSVRGDRAEARRHRSTTLVEQIDIGGPSLVRAAAKNFRDVLVVVDPADYPRLLAAARSAGRPDAGVPLRADAEGVRAHRRVRHRRSPRRCATVDGRRRARSSAPPPRQPATSVLADRLETRAREDPRPALRREPASAGRVVRRRRRSRRASAAPSILQGKELSYTNLLDLDAAARIVARVHRAGGGRDQAHQPVRRRDRRAPPADAYVRARDADRLAAFGGIVALNRPIDGRRREAIVSTFIEAVIAPSVDEAARADPREEGEHARGHGRLRRADDRGRTCARSSARCCRRSATSCREARQSVAVRVAARRPARRDQAAADGRGVGGAALRVAGLRAREVEHGDLHRRRAGRWRSAPVR